MPEDLGGFHFNDAPVPVQLDSTRSTGPMPEKSLRFSPADASLEVSGYSATEVSAIFEVYRDHMEKLTAQMISQSSRMGAAAWHPQGPEDIMG